MAPLRVLRRRTSPAPARPPRGPSPASSADADAADSVARFGPYRAVSRTDLITGAAAEESPSGSVPVLFDPAFYLDRNEDVKRGGDNPLEHYLTRGALEGRMPVGDASEDELHPLIRDLHRLDPASRAATAFHPAAYRFLNPDLATLDDDGLAGHYAAHGRDESRPCALRDVVERICDNPREIPLDFDPDEYAALYPEDMGSFDGRPLDALEHYMRHGRWERRPYSRRGREAAPSPADDPSEDTPLDRASRSTGASSTDGPSEDALPNRPSQSTGSSSADGPSEDTPPNPAPRSTGSSSAAGPSEDAPPNRPSRSTGASSADDPSGDVPPNRPSRSTGSSSADGPSEDAPPNRPSRSTGASSADDPSGDAPPPSPASRSTGASSAGEEKDRATQ